MSKPVTLLFHSELDDPQAWQQVLCAAMPHLRFLTGPACDRPEDVDIALVWTPPPQGLDAFPNLRAVLSLGAGVDQLRLDRLTRPGVAVARLVDPTLTARMVDYCKAAVFYFHRDLHLHAQHQARQAWKFIAPRDARERRVLVLGQGVLGAAVASALAAEGFRVAGWSRTPKTVPGVSSLGGMPDLASALADSDIVINMLPLTPQTRGILDRAFFARCKPGCCLVQAGRGAHLREPDLLEALDGGQVGAAFLDVFEQEPLPPQHPFWSHPQLRLTPHVASLSDPAHSAATVIENIRRAMQGAPLLNAVDRSTGY